MGFIDNQQEVGRKEIDDGGRTRTGRTLGDVARVILDAGAEAHLLHHLQIVFRAHLDALGLEQLAFLLEPRDAIAQFLADGEDGAFKFLGRGDELFSGINGDGVVLLQRITKQRIEARDAIDLVPEEFDTQAVLRIAGAQFHGVTAHAEFAALERDVIAAVLDIDEATEELVARDFLAHLQRDDHGLVVFLAAGAIDARDTGHHDDIAAGKERTHGGKAQALDLFVDARILLDERVRARNVSLRLVVIEVADEVFDRILRKEAFELGVELGGQRLVVRDHERGPVDLLDDVRHGEGFAGAGDAEQRLMFRAGLQSLHQLRNGLRLITSGFVWRDELEHGRRRYGPYAGVSNERSQP